MIRTVSTPISTCVAKNRLALRHLFSFSSYNFSEEAIVVGGVSYEARLVVTDGVGYKQQLGVPPYDIELSNISLETSTLLKNEQPNLSGAEATLKRLFLEADEAVTIYVARIATITVDEQTAKISLVNELDPSSTSVPERKYGPKCMWKFKDTNCGYTDNVDPDGPDTNLPFVTCSKEFDPACVARGRTARFPGFIHIDRITTILIEGPGSGPGYKIPRVTPPTE